MIELQEVSKRLRGQVVLDKVNLKIPDTGVIAILGPSGAGKSVLLKIVAGLIPPDSGRVFYDGAELSYGRFADNREKLGKLGFVFQGGALFDSLNVVENVALPLMERAGLARTEIEKRVGAVLEEVGMGANKWLRVNELSGGMVRLVAIARALVTEPKYVLLDEPTSGLDPILRERVCAIIKRMVTGKERSVVIVTHDLESAKGLTDRLYILKGCRLFAPGDIKKEDYEPADS